MRKVFLWDVIVNSTFITPGAIQKNVFFWNDGDPCAQPMQLNVSLMEPCQMITGYDYFEVSSLLFFWQSLENCFLSGQRACVHLRLCLPGLCPNRVCRRWIRRGQAPKSPQATSEDQAAGTADEELQTARRYHDGPWVVARQPQATGQDQVWARGGHPHHRTKRRESSSGQLQKHRIGGSGGVPRCYFREKAHDSRSCAAGPRLGAGIWVSWQQEEVHQQAGAVSQLQQKELAFDSGKESFNHEYWYFLSVKKVPIF